MIGLGSEERRMILKSVSTINGKINGIPIGVYLPISKLHSILA